MTLLEWLEPPTSTLHGLRGEKDMAIGFYHSNGTIRLYARKHRKAVRRSNGARTVLHLAPAPHVTRDSVKRPSVFARIVNVVRRVLGGGK